MEALIILGSSFGYLTAAILTARMFFARWRPSSVVVTCIKHRDGRSCPDQYGNHFSDCYKQRRRGERVGFGWVYQARLAAIVAGLLWLLFWMSLLVTERQPELSEERKAREQREIKERQDELAELDRQLTESRRALGAKLERREGTR